MPIRRQEALDYHSQGRPGKIQVSPTKPFKNQRDLSLAYTPGVAEPCREIAQRPEEAYTYTAKGNLVAVVTNGTAVVGLGNTGPPSCFSIEEKLRETLSIPVFHDDQHGTAIISGAALLNALELVDKDAGKVMVV